MRKRFDDIYFALMLAAGVAVVLAGWWCLSHSIARAGGAAPIPVASSCIRLPDPDPEPEPAPEPTPAYDPAVPLSAELQAALFDACAEHGVPVALGRLLEEYGDTAAALTAYAVGYDAGGRTYAGAVLEAAEWWKTEK